jgi:hypothetical protein
MSNPNAILAEREANPKILPTPSHSYLTTSNPNAIPAIREATPKIVPTPPFITNNPHTISVEGVITC